MVSYLLCGLPPTWLHSFFVFPLPMWTIFRFMALDMATPAFTHCCKLRILYLHVFYMLGHIFVSDFLHTILFHSADICKTTQSFCYLPIFFLAYMHHLFPLYFHNLSLIQHRLLPQYSFVVLLFQQNHFYFLLNTLPPFGQKHKDFKLSVQLEILPSLPVLHIAIYL